MAFKQINSISQYMNEDSMLETYARGGKKYLLTKCGEIEIDSTTYNALMDDKPVVEGKSILNFDKIAKAWKVQTGTGPATGTAFAVGDTVSKIYFDTTKSVADMTTFLSGLDYGDTGFITYIDGQFFYNLNILSEGAVSGYCILCDGTIVFSTNDVEFEPIVAVAGWQNLSSDGSVTLEEAITVSSISQETGWNGTIVSKTAFEPSATYDYFFELSNGEIIQPDSTAYNAIITNQNGFYAVNGDTNPKYYNRRKLLRAYTDGTNKFAQLINGDILPVSNTQWASFTSGSYPFAEVVDDTIYFNADKFVKLIDNGKFIEFKGGQRIAIDSTLFNTIKGDLTKIGDKYYYDTTQIVSGTALGNVAYSVTVSDKSDGITVAVDTDTYKTKVAGSTTPLVFVCDQTSGSAFRTSTDYAGIYFNTAQTLTEPSENKTYATFTSSGTALPLAYAQSTRKLSFNGNNIYDYETNTWDSTTLTSGYLSFGEGITYTYTSGESTWNGLIISPTSFSEATYIWKIGTSAVELGDYGITVTGTLAENKTFKTTLVADTTNVVCDLYLSNGVKIADVTDEVYNAITTNFKSVNGIKYNPVIIHKVFNAGSKYFAEFVSGYQVEFTTANKATEYNAFVPVV